MYLVDFTRQFLSRYYPRQHIIAAGFLTLALVIMLLATANDASHASQHSNDLVRLPLGQLLQEAESTLADSKKDAAPPDNPVPVYPQETIDASGEIVRSPGLNELPGIGADQDAVSGWQHVEVKSGDNLSTIFSRVGLSDRELFHVVNSHDEAKVLNRIYPGYQLSFLIPKPGVLEQLKVLKSPMEGYLFSLVDGFYEVETIIREPEVRQVFKHGTITDSLFLAGQRQDIPTLTIMEMANIFGGVVDFILDPRLGDHFSILFEENYLDGEFVGTGNIIAAQFTNQGEQHVAVQYQDVAGEIGYYNPRGESMRKAFLRTPLDVFRISSNFSLARRHPILNTIRAHKGTDYAAPRGTPVRATSDGRVTWAARNGTFGNLVVIKHDGGFETKYAHLNGYASGVKKGVRIRQGDIIGYVGATGSATGPHLHYEFLVNGVHQNPRTVLDKLPKAVSVAENELDRFRQQVTSLLERFHQLEQTRQLAQQQLGAE
jgi:murein DD-endopeptidase MepM/ murein hydrolase activator NlpD